MPGNTGARSRSPNSVGTISRTRNPVARVESRPGSSQTKYSIVIRSPRFAPSSVADHSVNTMGFSDAAMWTGGDVRTIIAESIAVTSEYGISRFPRRRLFARYVNTGWLPIPVPANAACVACNWSSSRSPASDSTAIACGASSVLSLNPTSSSRASILTSASSASTAAPAFSGRPDTSSVFTRLCRSISS